MPSPHSHHVVVIGGGLAGLSAAFAASRNGAYVTLVDKEVLGGNSAKATSGANAVATSYQAAREDIADSVELFIQDTEKSGHGKCDPTLVHVLAAQSGAAVDSLRTDHGLILSDIEQLGGHSAKRTHRFPPKDGRVAPVGWTVINQLKQDFKQLITEDKAALLEHTALVDMELSTRTVNVGDGEASDKFVSKLTLHDLQADKRYDFTDFSAVVFAAGGYSADSTPTGLLAKFRPDLIGFPTTNGPFAKGETTVLGMKQGLKVVDIEEVQLHPTGFVHPDAPQDERKFLCPEVMRGVGAILLNTKGERFINELKPRDVVSAGIREHGANSQGWQMAAGTGEDKQRIALLVMNGAMAERFGAAAFNFYKAKGFFFEIDDADKLRQKVPTMDPTILEQTLRTYDEAADGKIDDPFGKTVFPMKFYDGEGPNVLYGGFVTPSLHFSMGGLAISQDGRALAENDRPVLNLFVAGENAGGIHGGNRLGGNGCLESMVFGRLTGRMGAKIPVSLVDDKASSPSEVKSEILSIKRSADEKILTLRLALESPIHYWPANAQLKSLVLGGEKSFSDIKGVESKYPGFVDVRVEYEGGSERLMHPGTQFVAQLSY